MTSFWTSKLYRTSGFLVLFVQLFPYFHHCKFHLKKRTVALDPLPPAYVVYAHGNDDKYGRPLTQYAIIRKQLRVYIGKSIIGSNIQYIEM